MTENTPETTPFAPKHAAAPAPAAAEPQPETAAQPEAASAIAIGAPVEPSEEQKKERRAALLWRVLYGVAIAALAAALIALGVFIYGYWSAGNEYRNIADDATNLPSGDEVPSGLVLGDLEVDWGYLIDVNEDVAAWIYVPGTRINYPVVQGADNEEYLSQTVSFNRGITGRNGCIFLDADNTRTLSDLNSFLYGHNMIDGSMFAAIANDFPDQEFFDAHRHVYVLTPSRNLLFETFAVVETDAAEAIVEGHFADAEAFADYVADKQKRSVVEPSEGFPDPDGVVQTIALSTCDYDGTEGRTVLFCRLIDSAVPGRTLGGAVDPDEVDELGPDGATAQDAFAEAEGAAAAAGRTGAAGQSGAAAGSAS